MTGSMQMTTVRPNPLIANATNKGALNFFYTLRPTPYAL